MTEFTNEEVRNDILKLLKAEKHLNELIQFSNEKYKQEGVSLYINAEINKSKSLTYHKLFTIVRGGISSNPKFRNVFNDLTKNAYEFLKQ